MAVKIKMLKERVIPVLYEMGKVGEIYKVNNEVALELVLDSDAEYVDSELAARFKPVLPKVKIESATIEPEENAMMPSAKPKKCGWRSRRSYLHSKGK